jgi:enoyl-CoA hydratase
VIQLERRGTVAVARLDHGKVQALDVDLLDALIGVLDEIELSDARAVVLTGTGSVFSAGVDLRQVLGGGADYLDRFVPRLTSAFERLFSYPLPVVAAVNGAAVAGGCVMACACDRRMVAAGARIGATELVVGVPFPVSALEILRSACGDSIEEVILGGRLYEAEEGRAVGLVDEVVPAADLLDHAVDAASGLGSLEPAAFRLAKAQLRRPALERIAADGPVVDPGVKALWSSPQTLASIRAQVERIGGERRG